MYTIPDVSAYVGIPRSTLRTWVTPRYSTRIAGLLPALIEPPDPKNLYLSFFNLVEAHILLSTRRDKRITMPRIRRALQYVREVFPSPHPLIDRRFRTDGKYLFIKALEEDSEVINASEGGQVHFGEILDQFLERIEPDRASGWPIKLYPMGTEIIEINPDVSSGRPTVKDTGVLATALWDRRAAGETIDSLAEDFGLTAKQVNEAVDYIQTRSKAA